MPKLKRLKILRRHFKFFSVHCDLREPYKVVLDGNFVHALLEAKLGALTEEIPRLLGSSCKIGVTKCITKELRDLGNDFAGSGKEAKKLDHFRCGHVNPVSATECIRSLVGEKNEEGFSVATQDSELKKQLSKVEGGVPVFYASAFGVQLEPPTDRQRAQFETMEAKNLLVPEHEVKSIALDDGKKGSKLNVRKQKKGPNPLSIKKSVKKPTGNKAEALAKVVEAQGDGEVKHKRKRQRFKKKGTTNGENS